MDLTPLYDLRDRLRAGAIAGADLSADDFRLKRALDALAPLEQAAPVFAKLGQLTRALLAPDCPDRAGALLDAITLADALLCTQGAVAVAAPLEPIPLTTRGDVVANAPYSVLAPLLDALTTSGSGKYSFVLDTHKNRPELFEDYRVKAAMVQALGASYAELADQIECWLCAEDARILPLLTTGFDPKGKKNMVRRVRVIAAVAGAEANSFYLSQLPEAEKEVRGTLIYALRLSESNAEKLVELCKTEKGASKKQAHFALAHMESPVAQDYWNKLAAKKPDQVAEYMSYATVPACSALVGQLLLDTIAPFEADPAAPLTKDTLERLSRLLATSLIGKSGPVICDCFRRMAALGGELDRSMDGKRPACFGVMGIHGGNTPFSQAVPRLLEGCLLYHPTPDLLALAEELAAQYGLPYAAPQLLAALLSKPAGEVYEIGQAYLNRKHRIFHKNELPAARDAVAEALGYLSLDRPQGAALQYQCWDAALGIGYQEQFQPIREPLDPRWYNLLMEDGNLDDLLFGLVQLAEPALCDILGSYFYQRALSVRQQNRGYLLPLKRCGWTKCEGLLKAYYQQSGTTNIWNLICYVDDMPGGPRERAEELERTMAFIDKHHGSKPWNKTYLEQYLDTLRRGISN